VGAVIAILLAGGRSTRLGMDKTTFRLNGEMLVERHLRQLRLAGVRQAWAVCNPGNETVIKMRTGVPTVLQQGDTMSAAVLTGLDAADADAVCAVCLNDIVGDPDYKRIFESDHREESIVIPTLPLERSFSGGYLDLDSASGAVRNIVEKPEGGCPSGAAANIMIHQIRGRQLLLRLASLLRRGMEYEAAVNELIQEGVRVSAVPVRWWVAIKTPDDIARAQAAAAQ
jgi:dTDP-glucose pyrophosphorylase